MAKQTKSRKELLISFYGYHRAQANYHLENGNSEMLKHHFRQMEIVGAEYRELLKAVDANPIEKPSAIDQVKFVAMSGYDAGVMH